MTEHVLMLRRPGLALGAVQLLVALSSIGWIVGGPDGTRVDADAAAAAVVGTLGLLSLFAPEATPRWILELSGVVTGAVIAVTMATRVTPQGVVAGGVLMLMLLVSVAMFVPLRRTVAAIVVSLLMMTAALVVNPVPLGGVYVWVLGAALVSVPALVYRLVAELRGLVEATADVAVRDPLTGALNRRGVASEAQAVHAVSVRAGSTTAVVAIDLDGFKEVNDSRGHAAGDDLLVSLVEAWGATLRTGDVLGRIGGDEFLVVLPQCDLPSAQLLVDRLRAAHPFPWSYGVAMWDEDDDLDDVVVRADALLYAAKPARRTQIDLRGERSRPGPAA